MSNAADNEFFDFANVSSRRSFALLGLGAIIGLCVAGYGLFTAAGTATNTVPPEYVALVNQRPIYRSDFLIQLQTTFSVSYDEATAEQKQKTLDDMINEELLVQRGLEVDLASYDPDVRNALVSGVELQMYADVMAKQPSEDELKAYYEQHREQYSSLGVLQLRDLVLNVESGETSDAFKQRAADAIVALRAGKNIDSVMQQYQLRDSLHLQQGGKADLGDVFEFAAEANLPKAVFAVVKNLPAGSVSEPIVVDAEGTHIVVMIKRRQSEPLDFASVRSRVWTDIKNGDQEKVRLSTIDYLRGKSQILIGKE
ncbi:MAG: peptidylprolyl isomerase [Steroidobacteraceae bacterium]